MTIGHQSTAEIDHKVDRATVSGVFTLGDILELINDGFDNRSFAPQELVRDGHQLIFHVGS